MINYKRKLCKGGVMTSEGIVREICDRFYISRYDLRKGLYEYEIEMYSNALNITEATLLWAIRECKVKKYNFKKNQASAL